MKEWAKPLILLCVYGGSGMGNGLGGFAAKSFGLAAGVVLLVGTLYASIALGATPIGIADVAASFTSYDESVNNQVIVRTSRMPRALIAAAVGASIAIAGALIQSITRNPLADPNVLGINYGASFFLVLGVTVLSISSMSALLWIAFLGAALGAAATYLLGSVGRDGLTPLKIILAGTAMGALFSSLTQALLVLDEQGLNEVLFWLTGSVAGRTMKMLMDILPIMAFGWIAALSMGRHLNVLAMGDEAAKGLGQRTFMVKLAAGLIIGVLAGCSVAVAGPIGFIGMVIPYLARFFTGMDYRWIIPYSAVMGAILLLLADIAARFVVMPEELPVGAMTAIVGVPFFIYVARKGLEKG
jgi:iron complex transport system permease protein